jgi:hypothetical protein
MTSRKVIEKNVSSEISIFKLKDQHKFMNSIKRFYENIQPSLGIIGRNVRNDTKLKNGTLLFEIFNEKQADNLLIANFSDSHLMHIERHTSLNLYPGIVTTDFLDEEI